jgi:hypothetical protein
MKFKILFQKKFISYWKNITSFYEHGLYILKEFKSHVKKLKYSYNIYRVNFENS